jgi:hypothetical protein
MIPNPLHPAIVAGGAGKAARTVAAIAPFAVVPLEWQTGHTGGALVCTDQPTGQTERSGEPSPADDDDPQNRKH